MDASLGCRVRPRAAVGCVPQASRRRPSARSARVALHPLQPRRHLLAANSLRLPQIGARPHEAADRRLPHSPPSRVPRAALVAESASSEESKADVTVTGDAEEQLRASAAAEGRAEEGGAFEWSRAWYAVGVAASPARRHRRGPPARALARRQGVVALLPRPVPPPPRAALRVGAADALTPRKPARIQFPLPVASSPTSSHCASARPQGRIDAEGRLACSYHGWAFAGSGACELIPQAAPEHPGQAPRAVCSPRACATAFPVREIHVSATWRGPSSPSNVLLHAGHSPFIHPILRHARPPFPPFPSLRPTPQGVLFVWPDEHSAQQADATPLPLPHGVEWEEYDALPHYTRRLAYGYEVLAENVVDLSHFPFAHHGVGMTTRDQGGPVSDLGVQQLVRGGVAGRHRDVWHGDVWHGDAGVRGFEGPIHVFGFPTYLRFQAPQLVFYHNTMRPRPPKFALLPRKPEDTYAPNTYLLLLYITPCAPGSSLAVQVQLVRRGDGKKLPSVPRWMLHLRQHQVFDGDSYFLHCQERVLQAREQQMEEARASKGEAQQGGGAAEGGRGEVEGGGGARGAAWRAFYMPTNTDLPVVAFHQWLSKYAGGAVAYPPPFTGVSLPPQPAPKEVVLERMASHTAHCTACSGALTNVQRLQLLLPAASLLSAAAAVASSSLRARLPLAVLALAAAAAAWKVREVAKEFVYTGWDHATRD
ncbi:unnamed protein product [Closterium sp. Naga37s-1]|nr:unnamed protein product [Closterium sp. Naga37s-1]